MDGRLASLHPDKDLRKAFISLDEQHEYQLSGAKTPRIAHVWANHEREKLMLLIGYLSRVKRRWPTRSKSPKVQVLKNMLHGYESKLPQTLQLAAPLEFPDAPETEWDADTDEVQSISSGDGEFLISQVSLKEEIGAPDKNNTQKKLENRI